MKILLKSILYEVKGSAYTGQSRKNTPLNHHSVVSIAVNDVLRGSGHHYMRVGNRLNSISELLSKWQFPSYACKVSLVKFCSE